jgi:hypothetical protein
MDLVSTKVQITKELSLSASAYLGDHFYGSLQLPSFGQTMPQSRC